LPRDGSRPASLDRAGAYVERQLAELVARVETSASPSTGRRSATSSRGSGPARASGSWSARTTTPFRAVPGADDNASGVAGLIELARLLGGKALSRPVELVALRSRSRPTSAAEDMGSAVHAASLHRAGVAVRAMLSLEMIGYFSDAEEQSYPLPFMQLFYPRQGNFIAVVGRLGDGALTRRIKRAMAGRRAACR